jgi:hypothetical protein
MVYNETQKRWKMARMFRVNVARQLRSYWKGQYIIPYMQKIVCDKGYIDYIAKKPGFENISNFLAPITFRGADVTFTGDGGEDAIDKVVREMPRASILAIQIRLSQMTNRDFAMHAKEKIEFARKKLSYERLQILSRDLYKNTTKYINTIIKQLDRATYEPGYKADVKLARLTYHLAHCSPRLPYAAGDGLRGLMIIGKPHCGKSSAFATLNAHTIATDAKGVGRWMAKEGQEAYLLDDWTPEQLTDEYNNTVLRVICLGRRTNVKVHGSVEETRPMWVVLQLTSNRNSKN